MVNSDDNPRWRRPPNIKTDRLTLRGHRIDDYAASAAMWADPRIVRHITGKPSTAQQAWMRLLNYAGHWSLLGFGYWVVEESETERFVGEVGFADFKRGLDPSLADVPEIGWALAAEMHGRGFATEALRAAVWWGDSNFRSDRTFCIIDPENAASLRVASKCAYREVRRVDYNGKPTILFARPNRPAATTDSPCRYA